MTCLLIAVMKLKGHLLEGVRGPTTHKASLGTYYITMLINHVAI